MQPRTWALALGTSLVLGLYLVFWLHLLPYLGVALGALAAVSILILGAAVGEDPERSTAAFRRAAPDLAGRAPGSPDPREPTDWPQPRGISQEPNETPARPDPDAADD